MWCTILVTAAYTTLAVPDAARPRLASAIVWELSAEDSPSYKAKPLQQSFSCADRANYPPGYPNPGKAMLLASRCPILPPNWLLTRGIAEASVGPDPRIGLPPVYPGTKPVFANVIRWGPQPYLEHHFWPSYGPARPLDLWAYIVVAEPR